MAEKMSKFTKDQLKEIELIAGRPFWRGFVLGVIAILVGWLMAYLQLHGGL